MIDLERARRDPAAVFDSPDALARCEALSPRERIELLQRWELEARALQVADDENMSGGERPRLGEVREALRRFGVEPLEPVE